MDYKSSGVDREGADRFIEELTPAIQRTFRPEVQSSIGDFGGFFRAPQSIRDPLWVATTDGVGTKLMLGTELQRHRSLGQDLVAMCVNDLLACRAEPIVFLDYLACGSLDRKILDEVVLGVAEACERSGCALIGGETAEMPGFYAPSKYDLAGFSIGVLERSQRLSKDLVQSGDVIIGFPSSGFHSNGFSLVRKIVKEQNWSLTQALDGEVLGDYLLRPTELYVKKLLPLIRKCEVHALAHITGGGLVENLPRGLNEEKVSIVLKSSQIETAPLMKRFVEAARLDRTEAFSTWNMGIGFCVICPQKEKDSFLSAGGREIGEIIPRENDLVLWQ